MPGTHWLASANNGYAQRRSRFPTPREDIDEFASELPEESKVAIEASTSGIFVYEFHLLYHARIINSTTFSAHTLTLIVSLSTTTSGFVGSSYGTFTPGTVAPLSVVAFL